MTTWELCTSAMSGKYVFPCEKCAQSRVATVLSGNDRSLSCYGGRSNVDIGLDLDHVPATTATLGSTMTSGCRQFYSSRWVVTPQMTHERGWKQFVRVDATRSTHVAAAFDVASRALQRDLHVFSHSDDNVDVASMTALSSAAHVFPRSTEYIPSRNFHSNVLPTPLHQGDFQDLGSAADR